MEAEAVHALADADVFHLAAFHHRAVLAQHVDQFQFHARQGLLPVAGGSAMIRSPSTSRLGQIAAELQEHAFRRRLFPEAAVAAHCHAKLLDGHLPATANTLSIVLGSPCLPMS